MRSLMNLENGMVVAERYENSKPEIKEEFCKCCFCREPIYFGDEYYHLPEGKVCIYCVEDCKRKA